MKGAHVRGKCATPGCPRLCAKGYPTCCRGCSGGSHGRICDAVNHVQCQALEMGQHLKSRLDLAPVRDLNADINFAKNVTLLTLGLSQIKTHKDLKNIADIAGAPPDGLVDYIRGLCPVHRLNPTVSAALRSRF